jgi:DNA-binding transcriptional ArsR family regulator
VETSKESTEVYYRDELQSIKEEIVSLRNELSRFLQRANQQHIEEMLLEMKKSLTRPIVNYLCEDVNERLHSQMTKDCETSEFCEFFFRDFLQETANLICRGKIEKKTLKMYRDKLEDLKKEAKTPNCSNCFSEASDLFEKQIKLMRSLQIYEDMEEGSRDFDISKIEINKLVSEVCEPVANRQRLLILKALLERNKNFSELSRLTGLRGGNLLFHLQKLLDTGMVLQRCEHGDYVITRKGYSTLQGLSRIFSEIEQD